MAYYEDIVNENGKAMCLLCSIEIPDNNTFIEAHINNNSHKEPYILRLLFRNSMLIDDISVKCLICNYNNIAMLQSGEHINSPNHRLQMDKLKRIIEKDGAFIQLPENEITKLLNCLICNQNIDFTMPAVVNHICSIRHKRARAIAVQPFNGIFSVENNKDLWCKICRVYFDNYIESIFEHVDENNEHVTRLTKLLRLVDKQNITIEKFLMDPKEDKAQCNKCKTEVSCNIDNIERHIKGRNHNS